MHTLQGSVSRLLIAVLIALLPATSAFGETPVSDPVITRGASWQAAPDSATDGRDFLLVWIDGRRGRSAVYAARVAADGSVLDPEGILVSDGAENAYAPSVAWTGSSYIVAWRQLDGQEDGCRVRRMERDGHLATSTILDGECLGPRVAGIDGTVIVASARNYGRIEVSVIESTGTVRTIDLAHGGLFDIACTRSECWLVWESNGSVKGRRLGRHGEALAQDRVLAAGAMAPKIAATEGRFLLVWRDRADRGEPSRRLWAQELDEESELGGPSQFKPFLLTETNEPIIRDASVSPSGRGFIVAWSQQRGERPIDRRPALGVDGAAYAPQQPQIEIRARRVGDGEEEPLLVARSNVARSEPPSITSNGVTHLGGWIESNSRKIAAGVTNDSGAFSRIAVTRTAAAQSEPHVVNCGDHLLVVWAEELHGNGMHSILARRFQFSGEAIDPRPIAIAGAIESQHRPVAAFDGHSYLVVWDEGSRVHARRLHRDGTPEGEALTLSGNADGEPPAVVGTDRGFAVMHGHGRQLMLTRIGAGSSLEQTVIAEPHDRSYALGWTGTELVAVWSGYDHRVQAARFTSDGVRLGPDILVGFGNNFTMSLSVACGASECIAAWSSLSEGVKTASIANGQAFLVFEPLSEVPYYRAQATDRYQPTVMRTAGEFKVITYGPDGSLYVRAVRDGIVSAESKVNEPRVEAEDFALAATPDDVVTVYSRSVAGPGYGGSRRLFLRTHAQ